MSVLKATSLAAKSISMKKWRREAFFQLLVNLMKHGYGLTEEEVKKDQEEKTREVFKALKWNTELRNKHKVISKKTSESE